MTTNVYKKYRNMRFIHRLISQLLCLSNLPLVYLLITVWGYHKYGLAIFGRHWSVEPTLGMEIRAVIEHGLGAKWLLAVLACGLTDLIAWPYFYRLKRAKIEYVNLSEGSETGSDSISEGGDARSA